MRVANLLWHLGGDLWVALGCRRLAALRRAATRVDQVQLALLRQKIRLNGQSHFGRKHGLGEVCTLADFRRRMPITTYEDYAPFIEQLKAGRQGALLGPREQLVMFAQTSGTSGAAKSLPVTRRFVREYREGWSLWAAQTLSDHPDMLRADLTSPPKRVLQLSGNACEFRTPTGVPCGTISGLLSQTQRRLVRSLYCLPAALQSIADPTARYYTILRLAIPANVGHVVTANPSTLNLLARLGDEWNASLIRDIAQGSLDASLPIASAMRELLSRRIGVADPARARELERIVDRTGSLHPKDYWPGLRLIGTWTGGTVGAYLGRLPDYYGAVAVRDIGLLASEGRMTIPLEDHTPSGVLDFLHTFFEFVPREEIDSPKPSVLMAHELTEGREYFILLTTSAGLYRYHIHDVVRCTGHLAQAPMLEFLNKGSQFSSVTGEKLSEHQVVNAVRQAGDALRLRLSNFVLAPCWGEPPYYALLVETNEVSDLASEGRSAPMPWIRLHGPHGAPVGAGSPWPLSPHAGRIPGAQAIAHEGVTQHNRAPVALPSTTVATARQLAAEVDTVLRQMNCEYECKRNSSRLGRLRVRLVPQGTWQQFDAAHRAQRGGSVEQYKRPCLISDLSFVAQIPMLAEF